MHQQTTVTKTTETHYVNPVQTTTTYVTPVKTHKHETLKGVVGGAAVASIVPGVGTVVGGVIGGIIGHHEKNKHIREGTHRF